MLNSGSQPLRIEETSVETGLFQHFFPALATFSTENHYFCSMKLNRIVILLITLLPFACLLGQEWQVIDMRHGLAESRVRQMKQMVDGRMAIATTAAIDIFDGTRFTSYKLPPERAYPLSGFQGDRQLSCDSAGRIWLRHNRQLYVVDSRRGEVVRNIDSLLKVLHLSEKDIVAWPRDSVASEYEGIRQVRAVVHDSYGGLWVGTKESGILYSNPCRLRQFHTYADSVFLFNKQPNFCSPRTSQLSARYAPSATNCTLEQKTGYAYLGTRSGLMIIDDEDRLITTLDERDGLSTNNIYALIADRNDDVWAASANGLSRIHTTGRDSFDITNYGRFDGINVEGCEFRTCHIHLDTIGAITVGFVGGIVFFHPDSVTVPRYTFHYPRDLYEGTPTETSFSSLWLIPIVILLLAVGVFLYRRKRHTARFVKPSPVGSDNLIDKLKTSSMQEATADEEFLTRLQTIVEANIGDEDFSVQTLSEQMAMDRTGLYRRMQMLTGQSPSIYIKHIRMDVAARLLRETTIPIAEIAIKTGFSSTKYFNHVFKDEFGLSPLDYRSTL